MKVNFIIAGSQKCGTTALFDFLTKHPKVIGSTPKEVDFFNYNLQYDKGVKFYHSHFKEKLLFSSIRGYNYVEASPSYMNDGDIENTGRRMYDYNKKIKIIILVRNPIDRAFSAWNMYRNLYNREGNTKWWFDWVEKRNGFKFDALKREEKEFEDFYSFVNNEIEAIEMNRKIECSILEQGHYHNGIKAFKEFFGSNVLVMKNEDLKSNSTLGLNQIASFLKLSNIDWSMFEGVQVRMGQYQFKIDDKSKDLLTSFYKESNTKLFELTGINYL